MEIKAAFIFVMKMFIEKKNIFLRKIVEGVAIFVETN